MDQTRRTLTPEEILEVEQLTGFKVDQNGKILGGSEESVDTAPSGSGVRKPRSWAKTAGVGAFLTRLGTGVASSIVGAVPSVVTTPLAAGIAGAGESIAQKIESPDPVDWSTVGVESAIGAVPLGKIYTAGKPLISMLRGAGAMEAGNIARRYNQRGEFLPDGGLETAFDVGTSALGGLGGLIPMQEAGSLSQRMIDATDPKLPSSVRTLSERMRGIKPNLETVATDNQYRVPGATNKPLDLTIDIDALANYVRPAGPPRLVKDPGARPASVNQPSARNVPEVVMRPGPPQKPGKAGAFLIAADHNTPEGQSANIVRGVAGRGVNNSRHIADEAPVAPGVAAQQEEIANKFANIMEEKRTMHGKPAPKSAEAAQDVLSARKVATDQADLQLEAHKKTRNQEAMELRKEQQADYQAAKQVPKDIVSKEKAHAAAISEVASADKAQEAAGKLKATEAAAANKAQMEHNAQQRVAKKLASGELDETAEIISESTSKVDTKDGTRVLKKSYVPKKVEGEDEGGSGLKKVPKQSPPANPTARQKAEDVARNIYNNKDEAYQAGSRTGKAFVVVSAKKGSWIVKFDDPITPNKPSVPAPEGLTIDDVAPKKPSTEPPPAAPDTPAPPAPKSPKAPSGGAAPASADDATTSTGWKTPANPEYDLAVKKQGKDWLVVNRPSGKVVDKASSKKAAEDKMIARMSRGPNEASPDVPPAAAPVRVGPKKPKGGAPSAAKVAPVDDAATTARKAEVDAATREEVKNWSPIDLQKGLRSRDERLRQIVADEIERRKNIPADSTPPPVKTPKAPVAKTEPPAAKADPVQKTETPKTTKTAAPIVQKSTKTPSPNRDEAIKKLNKAYDDAPDGDDVTIGDSSARRAEVKVNGKVVASVDKHGTVSWQNDSYRKLTGLDPKENKAYDTMGGEDTPAGFAERLASAIRAGIFKADTGPKVTIQVGDTTISVANNKKAIQEVVKRLRKEGDVLDNPKAGLQPTELTKVPTPWDDAKPMSKSALAKVESDPAKVHAEVLTKLGRYIKAGEVSDESRVLGDEIKDGVIQVGDFKVTVTDTAQARRLYEKIEKAGPDYFKGLKPSSDDIDPPPAAPTPALKKPKGGAPSKGAAPIASKAETPKAETSLTKQPKRTLKEFEADAQKHRAEVEAEIKSELPKAKARGGVELVDDKGRKLLIHETTYPDHKGEWQITHLLADGTPSGHTFEPTLEKAYKSARGIYDGGPPYGGREFKLAPKQVEPSVETPLKDRLAVGLNKKPTLASDVAEVESKVEGTSLVDLAAQEKAAWDKYWDVKKAVVEGKATKADERAAGQAAGELQAKVQKEARAAIERGESIPAFIKLKEPKGAKAKAPAGKGPTNEDIAKLSPEEQEKTLVEIAQNFKKGKKGRVKNETGETASQVMFHMGLAAIGAGVGFHTNPDAPGMGALIGAGAFVSAPTLIRAGSKYLEDASLSTSERAASAKALATWARDKTLNAVNLFPDAYRASLLSSLPNLPINAWVGPYGSAIMAGVELALAGDEIGFKILKNASPLKFAKNWKESLDEADELLKHATERTEDLGTKGGPLFQKMTSLPAKALTAGDIAARKWLMDAGLSENVARAYTLTSEPIGSLAAGIGNMRKSVGRYNNKQSWFLKMVMPFYRTNINQIEQGLMRVPVLGSVMRRVWKDTPIPLQQEIAQQVVSAGAIGGAYALGALTPKEHQRDVLKLVSNFGGVHGSVASLAFAAGMAARRQEPVSKQWSSAIMSSLRRDAPMPNIDVVYDFVNSIEAAADGELKLPYGFVPPLLSSKERISIPSIIKDPKEAVERGFKFPRPYEKERSIAAPFLGTKVKKDVREPSKSEYRLKVYEERLKKIKARAKPE